MKKTIIYSLLSLLIIGGTILVFPFEKQEEEEVVKAFADTKFINMASNVECIINCGQEKLTKAKKKQMVLEIANNLGIKDGYTYGKEKNKSGKVMTLHRKGTRSEVYIKLLTVTDGEEFDNYMLVNIILENSIESALFYKEELAKSLSKYEKPPKISVNLAGTLTGRLTKQEKNKIAENLLDKTKSKTVIDGREEEIYTIYGYTDKVKEFITVGSERVNINLAITYEESNNQTKVYLSTPIINLDY